MFRTLFRILAAALLTLAVPIQGLASASAGVCMALGAHDGGHGHAASAHEHDHEQTPAQDHHLGNGHCAPCVSCCAAAAIAPATAVALPDAPPVAAVPAPQYWTPGVPPDELDRPPLAL